MQSSFGISNFLEEISISIEQRKTTEWERQSSISCLKHGINLSSSNSKEGCHESVLGIVTGIPFN